MPEELEGVAVLVPSLQGVAHVVEKLGVVLREPKKRFQYVQYFLEIFTMLIISFH